MLPFVPLLCLSILLSIGFPLDREMHPGGRRSDTSLNIDFAGNKDPYVSTDSLISVIPFTRAGNLILLKGKVDTTEGNFVLDTGAPGLILNMTYFRHYLQSDHVNGTDDGGGITGLASGSSPTIVEQLTIGPVKYTKVTADRINLGHIENSKGVKILGLLGMQLFKRFEIIIDYEMNLLTMRLVGKKENAKFVSELVSDTAAYNTFPIKLLDNKLLTYGEMGGKKLTFIIDTGAESNVLDSRLPERIFKNVDITRRVILTGTGNSKVEALYGDMKNMKLGHLEINTLPVLVTNLQKLCFAYDQCIDGMLGFDFLSLHKIGFNFVTRKMYIWK